MQVVQAAPLPVPVQVRSKNDGSGVAASVSGVRRRSGSQGLRSPAAKRPLSAPVALQGWLHKQGSEGLMLWKKRWFVLSEYCLFYYKGQTPLSLPLSFSISFSSLWNYVSRSFRRETVPIFFSSTFPLLSFSLFPFVYETTQDTIPNVKWNTRLVILVVSLRIPTYFFSPLLSRLSFFFFL